MTQNRAYIVGFSTCALIAGVIFAGTLAAQQKRSKPPEQYFLCYMHGKITERQTGVATAEEKVSGPAWKITYTEGGYAIYAQREGESCQTEIAR